jgi:hypothetical protein
MHNNKLSGSSQQFVFAPSQMTALVLSYNQLSGNIPRIPRVLQLLDLAQNNFTGERRRAVLSCGAAASPACP